MTESGDEYRDLVVAEALSADTFLQMSLSRGAGKGADHVTVRPVELRGVRNLQFTHREGRRQIARNFAGPAAEVRLREVLDSGFLRIHVLTTEADLHIRVTKKGRVLFTRGKPSRRADAPAVAHDHVKSRLLDPGNSRELLAAIGLIDGQGRILPSMQAKYRQICEFLKIVQAALPANGEGGAALNIVDCGCGSAYLTFAVYHYLNHLTGCPARMAGIDANPELIAKCEDLRGTLGWPGPEFVESRIADYTSAAQPDMVLSLHACDTATDEAIARGIEWESRVILASPCCQHELNREAGSPVFGPVLRHGILRERMADILTDAFRAHILQIMGYRAEVVEFVSPEHTAKNLLIRAVRGGNPDPAKAAHEYTELKTFWGVTPALEVMLGESLRQRLA